MLRSFYRRFAITTISPLWNNNFLSTLDTKRFLKQVMQPSGDLSDRVFLLPESHQRTCKRSHIEITDSTIRLVFDGPCDEYRNYARLLGPDGPKIIENENIPEWMIPIKTENLVSVGAGAVVTLRRRHLANVT